MLACRCVWPGGARSNDRRERAGDEIERGVGRMEAGLFVGGTLLFLGVLTLCVARVFAASEPEARGHEDAARRLAEGEARHRKAA